jgi:cell division protein ZapA
MTTQVAPISVFILDREYRFTCEPHEREALKAAAEFLDNRMRKIKESSNLMALERIAVMTALNLADELLKLQSLSEQRVERVDQRIRRLADELEDAVAEGMD